MTKERRQEVWRSTRESQPEGGWTFDKNFRTFHMFNGEVVLHSGELKPGLAHTDISLWTHRIYCIKRSCGHCSTFNNEGGINGVSNSRHRSLAPAVHWQEIMYSVTIPLYCPHTSHFQSWFCIETWPYIPKMIHMWLALKYFTNWCCKNDINSHFLW